MNQLPWQKFSAKRLELPSHKTAMRGASLQGFILALPVVFFAPTLPTTVLAKLLVFWLLAMSWTYWESRSSRGVIEAEQASQPADWWARFLAAISCWALLGLFWCAEWQATHSPAFTVVWSTAVGAGMFASGIGLRSQAIRTLGSQFRTEICVARDNHVCCDGLYRWLRHPSETGLLLIVFGTTLFFRSVMAFGIASVVIVPLMALRVSLEERELVRSSGDEYRRYAARVRRFVPFVV